MSKPFYIHVADVFCEDCGDAIKERITGEGHAPADPGNEATFDSDEFPKGPFDDEESDTTEHCGAHDKCLNAYKCKNGTRVGMFLENPLTKRGYDYVREEHLNSPSEITEMWVEFYEIDLIGRDARERVAEALGHVPDDETIIAAIRDHADTDTDALREELAEKEIVFNANGGRGVELADEIDSLRTAITARDPSSENFYAHDR